MELNVHREITALSPEDCFIVYNRPVDSFNFPIHFHPEYELNLIYNGKGVRRVIGDHLGETDEVELVLVGSNLVHGWEMHKCTDPSIHEICLQFQGDLLDEKMLSRNLFNGIKTMLDQSSRGILFSKKVSKKIIPRMHKLSELRGVPSYLELIHILSILSESKNQTLLSSTPANKKDFENSFVIKRVHDFVMANYQRKISLEEISTLVNMSAITFNRFIKRRVGKTFVAYVNDLRIGVATKLLIETNLTIGEIAFQCGFNNIANFNRIFKKTKKATPTIYRKEFKGIVDLSISL